MCVCFSLSLSPSFSFFHRSTYDSSMNATDDLLSRFFFRCRYFFSLCSSCSFSVSLLCIVNMSSGQRAEEAAGSTYSVDVGHSNYYSIELNT